MFWSWQSKRYRRGMRSYGKYYVYAVLLGTVYIPPPVEVEEAASRYRHRDRAGDK